MIPSSSLDRATENLCIPFGVVFKCHVDTDFFTTIQPQNIFNIGLFHWQHTWYIRLLLILWCLSLKGRIISGRSEEHTTELQSRGQLACRLLLQKQNTS